MVETRTDTIVAREPGRKLEAWHPERDQFDVSVRAQGDALVASVVRARSCTWALGERRRIATHVDKSADTTQVVLEGIAAGWLMAIGASVGESDTVSGFGYYPFAVGAALGGGFVYDLAAGGEETVERHEIVQTGVQEGRACEVGAGADTAVAFAVAGGPSLSCRTGPDGSCEVSVAPDVWAASGGTLVVDVSVDGHLLRHEQLKRGAQ